MILEVNPETIRDLAAAVHSARKLEPTLEILAALEQKVMSGIQSRSNTVELNDQEGQALRNVLLRRAYDLRNNPEAEDYTDLAERIAGALEELPADDAVDTDEPQTTEP